ncbi:MAG: nitroreductase family protein [Kineosporiaceae bacterium]
MASDLRFCNSRDPLLSREDDEVEFTDVIRRRRMIRRYESTEDLSTDQLTRFLELAVRAPSAGFSQGWDFVVLTRSVDRERFWAATTDPTAPADSWLDGMRTAPALVLCLSDPQRYLNRYAEPDKGWTDRDPARWPVPYWDVDTGMAALLLLLAGVDEGLGGCFFGVPPERAGAVRDAFDIPADRNLVGVVSLGHPLPDRRSPSVRRGRRPLSEVAHDGRFGAAWPG